MGQTCREHEARQRRRQRQHLERVEEEAAAAPRDRDKERWRRGVRGAFCHSRSSSAISDTSRVFNLIKTGPEFRFVKQLVLVQIVKLGDNFNFFIKDPLF